MRTAVPWSSVAGEDELTTIFILLGSMLSGREINGGGVGKAQLCGIFLQGGEVSHEFAAGRDSGTERSC